MDPIGASQHLALVRLRQLVGRDRRAARCSRSAAAGTGAAACSSTRATWRASAFSRCAAASGATGSSCRRRGCDMALTPTPAQPTYGFMNWFLNTDRKLWPSAPATAFVHIGNGTNVDLRRSRERPGRGRALDRQRRGRRLSQAADRGGSRQELGRSCLSIPARRQRLPQAASGPKFVLA